MRTPMGVCDSDDSQLAALQRELLAGMDDASSRAARRLSHGSSRAARILRGDVRGLVFARVLLPGPEEPAKAVALATRDHVDVNVRDALAHAIVERDKGSLRAERALERKRDALGAPEEGLELGARDIAQRRAMGPGHDERVSRKERPGIEKREAHGVLEDPMRLGGPRDDRAEDALRHRARSHSTGAGRPPEVHAASPIASNGLQGVERGSARKVASVAGVTGKYFNGMLEGKAEPQAYDADARAQLRALSDTLTTA